jgi:lipopolysaccharide export system permease protein
VDPAAQSGRPRRDQGQRRRERDPHHHGHLGLRVRSARAVPRAGRGAGGEPREGYWEFRDAHVFTTFEEPQLYGTYLLASNLDPNQIGQRITPPEAVPFWQLSETISRRESAGLDATRYRLQYDILIARPLLFVAMVLVAASVSLRFFRFGGVAKMILGGLAAGFLLYVATELMRDLGNAGLVRPAVAAWFPAALGSLLGSLALLYQEDG